MTLRDASTVQADPAPDDPVAPRLAPAVSAAVVDAALPVATRLCLEAAARIGVEAELLDREFGYLFALRRGDRQQLMLGGRSPLNDAVAARLAEDKHYSGVVLARAGLRVPTTARCLSPHHPSLAAYRAQAGMDPGLALARRVGFPVVVKPNRLSHGRGVRLAGDRAEVARAIQDAWELDAIALVQERMPGRDLRLDFLDGELLVGYERRSLRLRGDGRRTLGQLLVDADARFAEPERRRKLLDEPTFAARVRERGWTAGTVIPDGATLSFEDGIQNLNGVSTARLLGPIPEALRACCVRAGEALGLRHFGVDLKLATLDAPVEEVAFIEVNASPLLSQIYLAGHRDAALSAQVRVLEAIFA